MPPLLSESSPSSLIGYVLPIPIPSAMLIIAGIRLSLIVLSPSSFVSSPPISSSIQCVPLPLFASISYAATVIVTCTLHYFSYHCLQLVLAVAFSTSTRRSLKLKSCTDLYLFSMSIMYPAELVRYQSNILCMTSAAELFNSASSSCDGDRLHLPYLHALVFGSGN